MPSRLPTDQVAPWMPEENLESNLGIVYIPA